MNVIFVEPCFPKNQQRFPVALAEVGARVIGIGESPEGAIPDDVRRAMAHYIRIDSVCHEQALFDAVKWVEQRMPVHRLEATVEAHILPVARVREACEIPGTSVRTAYLCRDKPAMKEVLREGGVPCAASTGAITPDDARTFAAEIGYPLIFKPRDGAGAAGTYRVDNDSELEEVIRASGLEDGHSVAIEEFVEGHEAFYDTITIDGEVAHDFMSHYYPNVLEAMRTRWISPQFISTNRIDSSADYEEVRTLGKKVIELLGIETSATHMEWFYGPKGLRFAEIGCRPPGVGAWDLHCAGNGIDLYREWAAAVVHGQRIDSATREFSTGIVALRPEGDGTIVGYDGLGTIRDKYNQWIIDCNLPDPGTPTQPVEAGYMANAWIRMCHTDYDELRAMLDDVGETIQVRSL